MAENRRGAGRVAARVLAALLAVEPHRGGGKVTAGLRGYDVEDAHQRRYVTVVADVRGDQPRGGVVCCRRTLRSGACKSGS